MRFSNHAFKVECCRDERFVKARRVNPKNFFAELKRRNAYKVAIAYAVSSGRSNSDSVDRR